MYYQSVYLSPHLDDAVLSCGGRIYHERQAGRAVLVFTVMAGDVPPAALASPFVSALHARWGLGAVANPVVARRAEDRDALAVLGAEGQYGDWPDCIYRRHLGTGEFLYHSEEALFGPPHPSETHLVDALARRFAELPLASGGRVFVPLTAGGHADHRLVREAVELWGAPDGDLVYYEDYPYAERGEALDAMWVDGRQWQPEIAPLTAEALDAKIAAVACYRSQISTFFSSADEIGTRLRAFACAAGGGTVPAEQYWRCT